MLGTQENLVFSEVNPRVKLQRLSECCVSMRNWIQEQSAEDFKYSKREFSGGDWRREMKQRIVGNAG